MKHTLKTNLHPDDYFQAGRYLVRSKFAQFSPAFILMISHVLLNSLSDTTVILETNFSYKLDCKS